MRKHVFTWGGSFAIKKALAEKLHVREKWKHSISDDVVITNSLKEAKLQNMFVPGCVGISYPSKFSHITEFTTRQVTIVRWHWIEAFIAGFILYPNQSPKEYAKKVFKLTQIKRVKCEQIIFFIISF